MPCTRSKFEKNALHSKQIQKSEALPPLTPMAFLKSKLPLTSILPSLFLSLLENKGGVKGLVDDGLDKIPKIFIHARKNRPKPSSQAGNSCVNVPVIDFKGLENGNRVEIIDQIRQAGQTWGCFQVINHGIPDFVMDDMLDGCRQFHEQDVELKKEWWWYSNVQTKKVRYFSNALIKPFMAADWRDSLCFNKLQQLEEDQIPQICRKCAREYEKYVIQVKDTISELLSEALGLKNDCIQRTGCMKNVYLLSNYYPTCPEPELTLGISSHSDYNSLTLLLQDHTGGLQILHQNKWMDVPPVRGALIANVGNLMQVITNDKFKSVVHRVVVNKSCSRISVAALFSGDFSNQVKSCGPMKELLSEDNPPLYRETTYAEYYASYDKKGLDGLKLRTNLFTLSTLNLCS